MDPIEKGNDIFIDILSKYPEQSNDLRCAQILLTDLIKATHGLVIVDFIGYGGWDSLKQVQSDSKNGYLYLIDRESDKNGMPILYGEKKAIHYRSGLILHFKDFIQFSGKNLSGIFLRGYAVKEKTVKKNFSKGCTDFKILDYEKRHFRIQFERKIDSINESFDVHNTPIYSIAIVPKNTPLSYHDTQEILFAINFEISSNRLRQRLSQLQQVAIHDEDSICEKVNTGRRIFEFVLKIECCLIKDKVFLMDYIVDKKSPDFDKDYTELMLGDLSKLVHPFKPKNRQKDLNSIIRKSNKLSHDSGEPIIHSEAIKLFQLLLDYTLELSKALKDHKLLTAHYSTNFEKRKIERNPNFKIISFPDLAKDENG